MRYDFIYILCGVLYDVILVRWSVCLWYVVCLNLGENVEIFKIIWGEFWLSYRLLWDELK